VPYAQEGSHADAERIESREAERQGGAIRDHVQGKASRRDPLEDDEARGFVRRGSKVQKRRRGAALLFLDESVLRLLPFVVKTGSPVGGTPTLVPSFGRWEKRSAIGGVALGVRNGRIEARVYFRLLPRKAADHGDLADYLRQLARHLRGHVLVVWDNAGQHRGPALRSSFMSHGSFEAVRLPPYCPELTPDDAVWSWVKSKDFVDRIHESLRRMQRRTDRDRGCLRAAELPWSSLLTQYGSL